MSQNVHSDTGGIDPPAAGETQQTGESLVFDVLSDSTVTERWPQLARGYSGNDFATIRATVAVEWDDIEHEDLDVEPADLLDCAEGD
ncbi:hypothetical protein [Haloarchaeobius litoreus]|uniref:MbtH protein n=1 Tax=Haloarchaeobius litoreus TaxID=755306 RepID=A0ABD6DPG1_9EURY|nr:hypothetical protein [Haloarchaeobius litoreus]